MTLQTQKSWVGRSDRRNQWESSSEMFDNDWITFWKSPSWKKFQGRGAVGAPKAIWNVPTRNACWPPMGKSRHTRNRTAVYNSLKVGFLVLAKCQSFAVSRDCNKSLNWVLQNDTCATNLPLGHICQVGPSKQFFDFDFIPREKVRAWRTVPLQNAK